MNSAGLRNEDEKKEENEAEKSSWACLMRLRFGVQNINLISEKLDRPKVNRLS